MGKQKKKQEYAAKLWNRIARVRMPLTVVCILAFGAFIVYAKYIQTSQYNDAVTAKEFYFSSDVMDGGVHEIPALDVAEDGTTSATLTFHLMNHEDQLRYSEVAVDYNVTWKEENGNASETSGNGINLSGQIVAGKGHGDQTSDQTNDKTNDKTVTISGLEQGKTYTVTATATAPYTKTLTATIRVQQKNAELQASVSDHGNYIEVTVWTADKAKTIRLINHAAGLIPDNTDSFLENMQTGTGNSGENQSVSVALGSNASHVFRFFKSNAEKSYTATVLNDVVTVGEVTNE